MLKPEDFFALSALDEPLAGLFAGAEHVWDILAKLKGYLEQLLPQRADILDHGGASGDSRIAFGAIRHAVALGWLGGVLGLFQTGVAADGDSDRSGQPGDVDRDRFDCARERGTGGGRGDGSSRFHVAGGISGGVVVFGAGA